MDWGSAYSTEKSGNLTQQGLGQSPSGKSIWCILAWKSDIWWHQFFIFLNFSKKNISPDHSNSLTFQFPLTSRNPVLGISLPNLGMFGGRSNPVHMRLILHGGWWKLNTTSKASECERERESETTRQSFTDWLAVKCFCLKSFIRRSTIEWHGMHQSWLTPSIPDQLNTVLYSLLIRTVPNHSKFGNNFYSCCTDAKQWQFFSVITDQVALVQCYAIGRPRSWLE